MKSRNRITTVWRKRREVPHCSLEKRKQSVSAECGEQEGKFPSTSSGTLS